MEFSEKVDDRSVTTLMQSVSLTEQMTCLMETPSTASFTVHQSRFNRWRRWFFSLSSQISLSEHCLFVTRNLFKDLFISFPSACGFLKEAHVLGRKTSVREKVCWIQTEEWRKIWMTICFTYTEKVLLNVEKRLRCCFFLKKKKGWGGGVRAVLLFYAQTASGLAEA